MPRYRAMYDVLGDLVLPRGADALALQGRSCEVRLRNAKAGDDGHVHKLEATVIGTSESMEESVQELRTALAEVLDLVSFTTQSRFQVSGCRSVIEWDDNLRERQMFSIHYSDARLPPSPELHGGVGDTVNELLKLDAPDFITAAFSAYRKGCIATLKEDQFMSFFRVVELVAEHRVEKQRVPLRCAACKGALECPSCGEEATRTPFGRAAIDSLIKGVTGEEDPKLSKVLFGFRNGLTHGRRVKSIEKEYGVAAEACVDQIANLAWAAISSEVGPLCRDWDRMYFATYGSVVVPVLQARVVGLMTQQSEGPLPREEEIPEATITMQTSFDTPGLHADAGNIAD